jgi:hypothetical protein
LDTPCASVVGVRQRLGLESFSWPPGETAGFRRAASRVARPIVQKRGTTLVCAAISWRKNGTLVLYDVSSSDMEGSRCPLASREYSHDGRKGTLRSSTACSARPLCEGSFLMPALDCRLSALINFDGHEVFAGFQWP